VSNRNCGSCRQFLKIDGASTGHCTNPLVVSHQGGLVMYREAEIGCRRGWKQDLWEPRLDATEEATDPAAAAPVEIDRGRAAAWADSAPRQPENVPDLLDDSRILDDDDLFDPRKTRDIREAIRRAREAKKREALHTARREPQDRPILSGEQRSGEDTVIDVRSAPLERQPEPIVPPVSSEEIRRRVDEMRHQRRLHEPPPGIQFRDDEERYHRVPEAGLPETPADLRAPDEGGFAEPSPLTDQNLQVPFEASVEGYGQVDAADAGWSAPGDREELPDQQPPEMDGLEAGGEAEPVDGWPEQAPWAEDQPAFEEWVEQRPKRRSWLGSLLHRHHQPAPVEAASTDPLLAWEPDSETEPGDEFAPWEQRDDDALAVETEAGYYGETDVTERSPAEPAGEPLLPPLPYDVDDDELGEDYVLAEGRYGEVEEEDQAVGRLPKICATCRYFRPDGTCGNSFAFTFRRRVNEDYLSCASSIGYWWLPSDRYWQSVADFDHHGQPTPLLDRFDLNPEEQESDEETQTP
jgi:hypothetical protein